MTAHPATTNVKPIQLRPPSINQSITHSESDYVAGNATAGPTDRPQMFTEISQFRDTIRMQIARCEVPPLNESNKINFTVVELRAKRAKSRARL